MFFGLFGKNGRTAEQAGMLTTDHLPSYLYIGRPYELILGPKLYHTTLVGDDIWIYQVKERLANWPPTAYYVLSPFLIPHQFRLRKLVEFTTRYEILGRDDPSTPLQEFRAKRHEKQRAA